MTTVIEARGLTKTYGTVRALDGLHLTIPRGGVYGVLGPNGAGKSTLFRILLGLIRPTEGSATVMGGPVGQVASMRRMGSMIETPRFPPYMTARQVLRWLALEHGVGAEVDIPNWLERVGLTEAADRKVKGFSVGMLQRLGVAAALMSKPELVILDEPTSGMDPPGIQEMRALIRSLADHDGVTVVLASHQLQEVQRICDRVAILHRGRLVREGAVSELTASGEQLRLSVTAADRVIAILGSRGVRDGAGVLANVPRAEGPALIRALVEAGIEIDEARWVGADLESVFFTETGSIRAPETPHAG
ncbi:MULTISPECIES: ABC transporter ATP-binding protein [unclassified Brevundimonas]|uniref:ABC transporter ATP-binding protein n=1 Tax=unclassified Brevundimonas TaxID=2622653 RepID=UPI0006FBAD54|nr:MULTISPECIES: ABC transporter ATP-binding protein [unclassified Brevundimonas]KQY82036.1 ABC transporter ATP-binding protein [Brevundimonas sp. Root1423]KRA19721.1 ABC transporter ATP-binding protein [Brevundimonas sp. Root608]